MADPFEDVLNLEDQLYQEGYAQGVADGAQAGKIEGRALGLEKGYEKFLESGRLYGRSLVWANRLPKHSQQQPRDNAHGEEEEEPSTGPGGERNEGPLASDGRVLPPLPANPRLEKNIVALHALVEPDTLATDNTDEAVNDFDDRVKRAQGKAKVIEKMAGEQQAPRGPAPSRIVSAVPASG